MLSGNGCLQLSYILRFGRPEPNGRESAKNGGFRPLWPRTALGTYRNPGRGPKTEKTQFPGARGTFGGEIRAPQNFLPESAQLFCFLRFGRPDLNRREIEKYRHIVIEK